MSAKMEHSAKDLPANLPSQDSIVQYCAAAGYRHSQHGGFPQFWIKYGTGITVTLGEVLTQDQVARIVKTRTRTRTPGCGCEPSSFQLVRVPEVYLVFSRESCRYIAMQYVAGDTVARGQPRAGRYAEGDVAALPAAIKRPISLGVPADTSPGHVGGGPIGHVFSLNANRPADTPRSEISRPRIQVDKVRLSGSLSAPSASQLTLLPPPSRSRWQTTRSWLPHKG